MAEAWSASAAKLTRAGLEPQIVASLVEHRQTTDVKESWEELERLNLGALTIADERYPKLLKQIFDPPAVLFYRGNLNTLKGTALAVVGTRACTAYGRRAAKELTLELARSGLTIVSGLAYGIDTEAHRAALEAGGTTIAVLAGGLDDIYPTANQGLAQSIVDHNGLLLSEYAPRVASLKQNFPYRNRIIAGLTRGTLVVEGAPDSGSLITAKHALEANREVFAVPGSVFSEQSAGTNELLKLGAHLVVNAIDVLTVFGLEAAEKTVLPTPTPEQESFLKHLSSGPTHIDELVRNTGLSPSEIMAQLTMLEVTGYVKDVGGQKYVRVT
jgi:DNA processing protein